MSWGGAEPSSKQQSKQTRDACGNTAVTQEVTFDPSAAVNTAMGQHCSPWTPVEPFAPGGRTHPHTCTPMTAPIPTQICAPAVLHACTLGTFLSPTSAPQGHPVLPHPPWFSTGMGMSKHEHPAGRAAGPMAPRDSPSNGSTGHGQHRIPRQPGSSGSHGSACGWTVPGLCTSTKLTQHLHAWVFIDVFLGVGEGGAEVVRKEHRWRGVLHGVPHGPCSV